MARVVIFARNRICIDLINSLLTRDDEVVAVFSATAAPENSITKKEIKKHCKQLNIPSYSILNSQKMWTAGGLSKKCCYQLHPQQE